MTAVPLPVAESRFVVALDGFEGPIDLLLALARDQKVDLSRISILALADQYLAYIQGARALKLEIAADYLVTAAWLAYLKSRLLLPDPPADDEPSPAELAASLAARLRALDAVRRAGEALMRRAQLGEHRFARGEPEGIRVHRLPRFHATLHDLLQAYTDQRLRGARHRMVLTPAPVMRMEDALQRITRLLGGPDWQNLLNFLPEELADERQRRAAIAASFAAGLELSRQGLIELTQSQPFGPILVRRTGSTGSSRAEPDSLCELTGSSRAEPDSLCELTGSSRAEPDSPPGTPGSGRAEPDSPPGTPGSGRAEPDSPPGTPGSSSGRRGSPARDHSS